MRDSVSRHTVSHSVHRSGCGFDANRRVRSSDASACETCVFSRFVSLGGGDVDFELFDFLLLDLFFELFLLLSAADERLIDLGVSGTLGNEPSSAACASAGTDAKGSTGVDTVASSLCAARAVVAAGERNDESSEVNCCDCCGNNCN